MKAVEPTDGGGKHREVKELESSGEAVNTLSRRGLSYHHAPLERLRGSYLTKPVSFFHDCRFGWLTCVLTCCLVLLAEEEIDVETVAESRKPCRTAYSTANMPTAPTLQDRRELQRTVSAIVRRGRPSLSYDRRKRKRRLSSGDYAGDCGRKAVKRKQYRRLHNKTKRRRRQMARHSSSDSEELESTERRSLHNNLERQRRIDLRNAFEELRVLLPDTADNEKAAKVAILNSGAQYCLDLEHREKKLLMQKAELRKHQDRLREEVSRLRRSLAMRR